MTKKFIHHIMAVLMLAAVPAAGRAQNRQPAGGEESTTLLKAALKGVHVELRAGVLIGGTSPMPLPREIRSIESYNPTLCTSFEGAVQKSFEQSPWGVKLGVRLETKGMRTQARVKNYHMEMTADDGGYMVGAWTGHVTTKVRNTSLTFPVLATYSLGERWTLSAGPYLSWMFDGEFTGSAFDGYLRHTNPTGDKAEVSRASYDFSDDLRHFEWGAQVGAQWRAYKHLAVYADLEWGFNNIFPSDFQSVTFALYPIYANVGFTYIF